MIAPALRLVAAVRAGAVLVARPTSGVVHLSRSPLTPSGRYLTRSGRTVCGARTRRLHRIEPVPSLQLGLAGRRVCRRCLPLLPAALGVCDRSDITTRDEWLQAFHHLTVEDLTVAGGWTQSVDEAHQVSRAALMFYGAKPMAPPLRRTPDQAARAAMHDAIDNRRRLLAARAMTPEDREQRAAQRRWEQQDRERIEHARRTEVRVARIQERRAAGGYLMPWERDVS